MALNAKNIKGNDNRVEQPVLEIGNYPGRLVQIIDLGLQPQRPFKGKDKPPVQEVMFTYELVDAFMVDEEGNDLEDKPRWLSETLPFYGLFADKATSTKRYNAFDPQGVYDGDFSQAIDTPVNVTVVHGEGKDNKIYTNVGNVSAMRPRDAANCPQLKNPTKVFDLDEPDMDVFNALPNWIQEKIKSNLNFQGSPLQKALEAAPKEEKKEPVKKNRKPAPEPTDADDDDDVPY